MAFLNDLKRIFFGAKSLTSHAAEKAVDNTKEASAELWDKVQDTATELGKVVSEKAELVVDKTADLAQAAKEKFDDFVNDEPAPAVNVTPLETDEVMDAILAERANETAPEPSLELPPLSTTTTSPKLLDDVQDAPSALDSWKTTATAAGDVIVDKGEAAMGKAADFASKVGEKVLETGGKLTEKFGETAENVGEVLFEKGGEALDHAKDFAAGIGSKIMAAKDDLMSKAQAEAEKSGPTSDSLMDKAKELNQKLEDKISGNNTKFAGTTLNTGGSEFAKHDNFWEKADRFAKGDYQMKGEDTLELKPIKPTENPDDASEKKDKRTDDLIDDAIVES